MFATRVTNATAKIQTRHSGSWHVEQTVSFTPCEEGPYRRRERVNTASWLVLAMAHSWEKGIIANVQRYEP